GTARGLRMGTAALTTQGMREPEMEGVAALLGAVLRGEGTGAAIRGAVTDLAGRFPPYPRAM
ncbi:serine hydroxymethyltransferase, partial [Streptomyces sp. NPDC049577]